MKKNNVIIMYAIVFLQGLVFYGPVATLYRQSRGLNINQIFILESVFIILMLIFEVPWGYFADRFGYKITLLTAYFLFFISKIVFYKAHSFRMFMLEAIIIAIAISGQSGCDSALIYTSVPKEDSQKVFSRYSALGAAGFFTAALLSTIMVRISLDVTALMTIFPYGIAVLLVLFLKDAKGEKEASPSIINSLKSLKNNKVIFLFIIPMALIGETTHSICIFLNQLQYAKSGIDVRYFGYLTAGMQTVCIFSAKAYRLSNRFGENKLIVLMFGVITFSTFGLAFTSNFLLSIIIIAVIEGAFALCQPLSLDIQNKSISDCNRATILSAYAMIADIATSGINLVIGKAADRSLEAGILACGGISLLGFVMILGYFSKIKISKLEKAELKM
jgi:MFS family permease